MCYRLHLVTPLTLSEVRSMLPAGMTADLAAALPQRALREHLPNAQTVVELRRGACGCDFVIPRDPVNRSDETHLRARALRAGAGRAPIAAMLEGHRRPDRRVETLEHWQRALAAFVLEHARNAGPSVYHSAFAIPERDVWSRGIGAPATVTTDRIRAEPRAWLAETVPTTVVRE